MKKNLVNIALVAGVLLLVFFAIRFRNEADSAITERGIINKELEISRQKVEMYKAQIDSIDKLLEASRIRQKQSKDRQQKNIVKFNEAKDAFHRLDNGGRVIFWKNEFARKDTLPM